MSDLDTHVRRLDGSLAALRESGVHHLIGGETRPAASGRTFETRSPVDDGLIARVARGDAADIDAAAQAAKAAFPARAAADGKERKRLLHRIADLVVELA